jgi:hypothetical protein
MLFGRITVSDLNVIYPALQIWQENYLVHPSRLAQFARQPMPIPGCDVIVDAWVYQPGK